jgi:CelD/BcsL family acetyltransferase involved in cellulose biosynthesis
MASGVPEMAGTAALPTHLRLAALPLAPSDRQRWQALGEAAEPGSIFAEPWLMQCSLDHLDPGNRARMAVVEASDGQWIGALPLTEAWFHGRTPMPVWAAWSHPNQFVGSPLIRRGQAFRFWDALLTALSERAVGRLALVMRDLPSDDPSTQALLEVCRNHGRRLVVDRRRDRALLCARVGDARPSLCSHQRRRIGGLHRKLTREVGDVRFDVWRGDEVIGQVDSFLSLERAGWKGSGGSALDCTPATAAFFRDVMVEGAARKQVELAALRVGEAVLAISTQLLGRDRVYGFKMAYDESRAPYAPGLLLLDRLTDEFLRRGVGSVDSCASPGQQPLERLWSDRRELIDCRIALGGSLHDRLFSAMVECEQAVRRLSGRPDGA